MKNSQAVVYLFLLLLICSGGCDNTNYIQGKSLYETNCATCHMPDGSGVSRLYPAINNLKESAVDLDNMPCIIRYGQNKEEYSLEMAGIKTLRDIEINNIINYIINDMNGMDLEYQIDHTRDQLTKCKP